MLAIITVFILLSVTVKSYGHSIQQSSCFGTKFNKCDYFIKPRCDDGYKIRNLSAIYGQWRHHEDGRYTRTTDGCCVYDATDCTDSHTARHLNDICRACSWTQSCAPLRATDNYFLKRCNNHLTPSYVYSEHECVPEDYDMRAKCPGPGLTVAPPPVVTVNVPPRPVVSESAESPPVVTATLAPPPVSLTPTNGKVDSVADDGGNTVVVVAGVVVPFLLIVVAGVIVGFILWKRRKTGVKDERTTQPSSRPEDISNITSKEVHEEFEGVGDAPESFITDPVHQPNKRTRTLFAWFRNLWDSGNAKGKIRGNEEARCSYEHIHGDSPVISEVISPEENTNDQPSIANPAVRSPTGGRISEDMSAVDAGDSYIEFTFDTVDLNDPRLLKVPCPERPINKRPIPPTRPPPSPSGSPRSSPRPSVPLLPHPKTPALLNDNPTYDYAGFQSNKRRGLGASGMSDLSDNILEQDPEYDYAAQCVKVWTSNNHGYSGSSVYVDVDANSMTDKYNSSDGRNTDCGYEVPIQSQSGSKSAPNAKKPMIPKTRNNDSPDISKLNEGLLKATGKMKPLKPVSDKSLANSPNVAAETANEKANNLKGVRNMAKLFENNA